MEENFEQLGQIIDSIENLACALDLPMDAKFHVDQLKSLLPEKVKELKELFIKITGENPWE